MRKTKNQVAKSKPGTVNCLKCSRPFKSLDRLRLRVCNRCKANQERTGIIGERVSSCGCDISEGMDSDVEGVPPDSEGVKK